MNHIQIYKYYAEKNRKQSVSDMNKTIERLVDSKDYDILTVEIDKKENVRSSLVSLFVDGDININSVLVSKDLYNYWLAEDDVFRAAEKSGISFGIYLKEDRNGPFFYIRKYDKIRNEECFLLVERDGKGLFRNSANPQFVSGTGVRCCWYKKSNVRSILESQEKLRKGSE